MIEQQVRYQKTDSEWPTNPSSSVAEKLGQCEKCGIELYKVMAYYCPRDNCPCGLGSRSVC